MLLSLTWNLFIYRSLIKSKVMPALVESEEEEEEDMDSKDPLPEKLHNSMVTKEFWKNEKMLYSYVEDNE